MSGQEIDRRYRAIRRLSNSGKYKQAYNLARRLAAQYPKVLLFEYCEAVLSAEDDAEFSAVEIRRRHRAAAKKLKDMLTRMRSAPQSLRGGIRNEYYWFSHQPYKQYLLGKERINGKPRSYYSQGVGAVEVAKLYGLRGKKRLCLRWAKCSERAWLYFFKQRPDWANAYFFYAKAVGFQGRLMEMESALRKASKISGQPITWEPIKGVRREVDKIQRRIAKRN